MTKTVSSECSSLSDIDYDPITSTFAKLRAVISQEASLRKELDNLFVKRTKDAHVAVQNAQDHLELVKTQEADMREILKTESATASEIQDSASNTNPEDTAEREQAVEWERLKEAAMISILEQCHNDAAEKIRQKQEECDRLAQLEEDRLTNNGRERLAKEEEDRLAAQEAAMIVAVEAREQAETEQRQLEEERWAKEEEDRMQDAAMVEVPSVVVAPKKKKKGKEGIRAAAAADFLDFLAPERPIGDAGAEERLILEAEIRQLEADEAEWLNGTDAKRPDIAEAAEDERINQELSEEQERRLVAEDEESEYLHYLSLKEAAVVAEERLFMVQAELDALETQKTVIIQQVESVREQEASFRYREVMRGR